MYEPPKAILLAKTSLPPQLCRAGLDFGFTLSITSINSLVGLRNCLLLVFPGKSQDKLIPATRILWFTSNAPQSHDTKPFALLNAP